MSGSRNFLRALEFGLPDGLPDRDGVSDPFLVSLISMKWPIALSGIALLACALSISTAPASPLAVLFVAASSLLVAGAQGYLAWQSWRVGRETQAALSRERDLVERLPERTDTIADAIQAERIRAEAGGADARDRRPGNLAGLLGVVPSDARTSIALRVLEETRRRWTSGEDLRNGDLSKTIETQIDFHLSTLATLATLALAAGFVGTLLGLGIQTYFTQKLADAGDGILSPDFLAGSVLAVSKALVGIFAAGYAQALASALGRAASRVGDQLCSWLAYALLPRFDPSLRATLDLRGVFDATAESFRKAILELAESLRRDVASGAADAVETVRTFVRGELAELLMKQLGGPLESQLTSLTLVSRNIENAVGSLESALRDQQRLQEELESAPSRAAETLMQVTVLMKGVTQTLERALSDAKDLGSRIDSASRQVELRMAEALEPLPARESNAEPASAELRELIEEVRELVSYLSKGIESLAGVFDRTANPRGTSRRANA